MGNSEVGHINLELEELYTKTGKINKALREDTLKEEKALKAAFAYAKENNKKLHLLGLVSDGGIHAHINHLKGILNAANEEGLQDVYLHAFTDGRDCDPKAEKIYPRYSRPHGQNHRFFGDRNR